MSCMRPMRSPSEAVALPPSRRQGPGLGGGLRIMQDTPNSYLEVERRDSFLGSLGRGLGRRRSFAVVHWWRSDGSWLLFAALRAPLAMAQTCALHNCAVHFWLLQNCSRCRLGKMYRNPLLWRHISKPVAFSLPPLVLSRSIWAMCTWLTCPRFRSSIADFRVARNIYKSCALFTLRG